MGGRRIVTVPLVLGAALLSAGGCVPGLQFGDAGVQCEATISSCAGECPLGSCFGECECQERGYESFDLGAEEACAGLSEGATYCVGRPTGGFFLVRCRSDGPTLQQCGEGCSVPPDAGASCD